jgi:hypothetical protein
MTPGAFFCVLLALAIRDARDPLVLVVDPQQGPFYSVAAALAAAAPDDTLELVAGTYLEAIDLRGYPVHLRGREGAESTTLSGAGHLGPVLLMGAVEADARQSVTGCTVTDGWAARPAALVDGGGISVQGGGEMEVRACVIHGCLALSGGGIAVNDAHVLLRETVVAANSAALSGGGIQVVGASADLQIRDCAFIANRVRAPYAEGGSGGGLDFAEESGGLLAASTIALNDVVLDAGSAEGGGICASNADLHVLGCVITSNQAVSGGGVFLRAWGGARVDLERSEITHNLALRGAADDPRGPGAGAGLYLSGPDIDASNLTLAANQVWSADTLGADGAAIVVAAGSPNLFNNALTGNSGGAALTLREGTGNTWHGYNLYFDNPDGDLSGLAVSDSTIDLFVNPRYLDLDPEDYRPLPFSPMIDAGDPESLDPDSSASDIGAHTYLHGDTLFLRVSPSSPIFVPDTPFAVGVRLANHSGVALEDSLRLELVVGGVARRLHTVFVALEPGAEFADSLAFNGPPAGLAVAVGSLDAAWSAAEDHRPAVLLRKTMFRPPGP